jgi:hypothetical protein
LAAARDGWANLATPIFQNITHDSGLSAAAEPTSFASDGDGFMWAGTQSGLLRWDGYHFRRYVTDPKQPGSLPDNYVVTLHADTHGRLWVGTNVAGLVEYDRARDTFVRPGDLERLRGATINAIVSDGGEGLWVTSDQGLNHLDPSTGRLKATPLPAAGPKEAQTPYVDTALTDREPYGSARRTGCCAGHAAASSPPWPCRTPATRRWRWPACSRIVAAGSGSAPSIKGPS